MRPKLFLFTLVLAVCMFSAEPPPPKVISKGAKSGTYQAFPDICRLVSGDLLCVFYAGYAHISFPNNDWPRGGRICAVRSRDEGRTWSTPEVLYDSPDDDRDPHIVQLRNGTLLCSFFPYRKTQTGTADHEVCIIQSTDAGRTWSPAPRVLAPHWACSAPVREMPDGTLILGVYREDQEAAYGGVLRSTDGGQSWGKPIPIDQKSGVRLDAETDVILLQDGKLYAALRGDRVNMHYAVSPDLGKTWSAVQDIGFKAHCPHFTRLSSGVILLSHRLPKTAIHLSRDEGKTWQGPYEIDDCIGAYPSTVELRDHSVLIVYYEEGAKSGIRARKFRLNENGLDFIP